MHVPLFCLDALRALSVREKGRAATLDKCVLRHSKYAYDQFIRAAH